MKVPVVKLRNTKTGKMLFVNAREWAEDLGTGTWRGWTRVGERHTGESKDVVDAGVMQEKKDDKPNKENTEHVETVAKLPPVDIEAKEKAAAKTLEQASKETISPDAPPLSKPRRGRPPKIKPTEQE